MRLGTRLGEEPPHDDQFSHQLTPVERVPPALFAELRALQHRLRQVELVAYVALATSGGLLAGTLIAIAGGLLRL